MVAKPLRTKRKSASAQSYLRSLGATMDMANPVLRTSNRPREGGIVAWMFTKSQWGDRRSYCVSSLSGNCWSSRKLIFTTAVRSLLARLILLFRKHGRGLDTALESVHTQGY